MKNIILILGLLFLSKGFGQIEVDLIEIKTTPRDSVVNIDAFDFFYYIDNKKIVKKNAFTTFNYSNLALGKIESINTFNPLRTFVFYKDTNNLVVLDNRLNEVSITNFNTIDDLKLVRFLTPGNKNFVWLYDQNSMKLELFNYLTRETTLKTNPITSPILDITSDYNFVWLLTEDSILCYNYRSSLIYKLKNTNYTNLRVVDENLILQNGNSLDFYDKRTKEITPIPVSHQLINSFFVSQQNLYIYQLNKLHKYQIKF